MQAIPPPASATVPSPAAVEERGVLISGSHTPLTLAACAVHAVVASAAAGAAVQLGMTYANETNKDVPVEAVLPAPVGWTIVGCEAVYDGDTLRARFLPAEEDGGRVSVSRAGASSGDRESAPLRVPTTSPTGVAALPLPFTVAVGTSITLRVRYLAPLTPATATSAAASRVLPLTGQFAFTLPAGLIPAVRRPPSPTVSYNTVYTLLNQQAPEAVLQLSVRAALSTPLRGEPVVHTTHPTNAVAAVPLSCEVAYHGDATFAVACTLPLSAEASSPAAGTDAGAASGQGSASYQGGPITVCCDVQDTIEPLRLFVAPPAAAPSMSPSAAAVTLTPVGLDAKVNGTVNTEYVFVVDAHHTATAAAAGDALALALRALPASVHINVVVLNEGAGSQGEGYRIVYPAGSEPVQRVELQPLRALVTELNPQKPGTASASQLVTALDAILPQRQRRVEALPQIPGYVRHVVVLSDSAAVTPSTTTPTALAALIRRVAQTRHAARVSAVAITAASTSAGQHTAAGLSFLEMLARHGSGAFAEAVTPHTTSAALVSVIAATAVPTLTELRVSFLTGEGNESNGDEEGDEGFGIRPALSANQPLPAVPSGYSLTLYALMSPSRAATGASSSGSGGGAIAVHATGKVGGQVVEFMGTADGADNSADAASAAEGTTATTADAAQHLLRQTAATARVSAMLADGTPTPAGRAEIVQLSLAAGVPTPFTELHLLRAHTEGTMVSNPKDAMPGAAAASKASSATASTTTTAAPPPTSSATPSFASVAAAAESAQVLVQLEMLRRKWLAVLAARLATPSSGQALAVSATEQTDVAAPESEPRVGTLYSFAPEEHRPVTRAGSSSASSAVLPLLMLQERDGGFPLSADVADAVGVTLDALEALEPVSEAITPKAQMQTAKKTLWATVVAVNFMDLHPEPVAALARRAAVAHLSQHSSQEEWESWLAVARDLLCKRVEV